MSANAGDAHAGSVSYAASQHTIQSYSRSAAFELGRYGITVTIVAPGPMQTDSLTPREGANIAARTRLRRIGQGADVGDVADVTDVTDVTAFLASEQARWLTGQLLYVGGGWTMHQ